MNVICDNNIYHNDNNIPVITLKIPYELLFLLCRSSLHLPDQRTSFSRNV